MVYCTKCGTKNEDNAEVCVKCSQPLNLPSDVKRTRRAESTCFRSRERHVEDECFGLPYGGAIAGIIFGFVIILW